MKTDTDAEKYQVTRIALIAIYPITVGKSSTVSSKQFREKSRPEQMPFLYKTAPFCCVILSLSNEQSTGEMITTESITQHLGTMKKSNRGVPGDSVGLPLELEPEVTHYEYGSHKK
jgi:hypothetical protein